MYIVYSDKEKNSTTYEDANITLHVTFILLEYIKSNGGADYEF